MTLPPLDYKPDLRPFESGIAVIGAGGIVRDAHLPAYKKAGYRVAGICDLRKEAADAAAAKFSIPFVTDDYRKLLDRKDVDVVDVAIPDQGRLDVVREAAARGKHLLVQKPMAYSVGAAKEMVAICEKAGVLLAVNQNARWGPEFRAAWSLAKSGFLGDVYGIFFDMRNTTDSADWARKGWYAKEERFQILLWSIHNIDLVRFYMMGREPKRVFASILKKPGQNFRGEVSATMTFEFEGGRQAVIIDHNASLPCREGYMRFSVEGTKGMVDAQVSAPRSFEVRHMDDPDAVTRPKLEGEWYPDGFIGSMSDLLASIADRREPAVSGRDHLKTLGIIDALYRSAEEGVALAPTA
jgi:predicted dehydrogenase